MGMRISFIVFYLCLHDAVYDNLAPTKDNQVEVTFWICKVTCITRRFCCSWYAHCPNTFVTLIAVPLLLFPLNVSRQYTKQTVLKTNPEFQTLASEIKRVTDCLHRYRVGYLRLLMKAARDRPLTQGRSFIVLTLPPAFICIIHWTVDLLDATKEL